MIRVEEFMNAMREVWNWLLSYAGIVMSAVSAFFGLFRDRWQSRIWKSLPAVGIVVGVLWALAAAQHDARDHETQMEGTIKRVNDWVSQQTKPIKDDLDELKTRMGILGVKATVAQGGYRPGGFRKKGRSKERWLKSSPPGLETLSDSAGFIRGLKPPLPSEFFRSLLN